MDTYHSLPLPTSEHCVNLVDITKQDTKKGIGGETKIKPLFFLKKGIILMLCRRKKNTLMITQKIPQRLKL